MKLRKLMLLVALLGVLGWTTLTAFRVLDAPTRFHFHSWKGVRSWADVRSSDDLDGPHTTSFWPCYLRHLMGRPWPGDYTCPDAKPPFDGPLLPSSPPGG